MSRRHLYRALFATLVVGLLACATLKVYSIDRVDFPNKSGRLDNGLRVVIQPDPSQTHVRVLVRYDVGAAADPKEKRGIAHLLEHLAFRLGDELIEEKSAAAVASTAAATNAATPKNTAGKTESTIPTPTKVRTVNSISNAFVSGRGYSSRRLPALFT